MFKEDIKVTPKQLQKAKEFLKIKTGIAYKVGESWYVNLNKELFKDEVLYHAKKDLPVFKRKLTNFKKYFDHFPINEELFDLMHDEEGEWTKYSKLHNALGNYMNRIQASFQILSNLNGYDGFYFFMRMASPFQSKDGKTHFKENVAMPTNEKVFSQFVALDEGIGTFLKTQGKLEEIIGHEDKTGLYI